MLLTARPQHYPPHARCPCTCANVRVGSALNSASAPIWWSVLGLVEEGGHLVAPHGDARGLAAVLLRRRLQGARARAHAAVARVSAPRAGAPRRWPVGGVHVRVANALPHRRRHGQSAARVATRGWARTRALVGTAGAAAAVALRAERAARAAGGRGARTRHSRRRRGSAVRAEPLLRLESLVDAIGTRRERGFHPAAPRRRAEAGRLGKRQRGAQAVWCKARRGAATQALRVGRSLRVLGRTLDSLPAARRRRGEARVARAAARVGNGLGDPRRGREVCGRRVCRRRRLQQRARGPPRCQAWAAGEAALGEAAPIEDAARGRALV